jgi:hypothetical protein
MFNEGNVARTLEGARPAWLHPLFDLLSRDVVTRGIVARLVSDDGRRWVVQQEVSSDRRGACKSDAPRPRESAGGFECVIEAVVCDHAAELHARLG